MNNPSWTRRRIHAAKAILLKNGRAEHERRFSRGFSYVAAGLGYANAKTNKWECRRSGLSIDLAGGKAPQPFAGQTGLQKNESKTYETVIVGAGLCGLLTAYRLVEKGVHSIAVVDAGELAGGVTARTTAKITSQHLG